jgi:hypothetical protein
MNDRYSKSLAATLFEIEEATGRERVIFGRTVYFGGIARDVYEGKEISSQAYSILVL